MHPGFATTTVAWLSVMTCHCFNTSAHRCRFRGRKGASCKGDGQGTSKAEPYAYWLLDRKLLNRRASKQAAAKKGLSSILHAAKAGAAKGNEAKRRRAST